MKTYKEHYKKCIETYNSVSKEQKIYNLSLDLNTFSDQIPSNLVKSIDVKVVNKLKENKDITETRWSRHISNWDDIPEVEKLCKIVMPLIERDYFNCNLKVEHLHIYENKRNISLESSWQWHYDDCPQEFIKFAIYTNEVSDDNGCMQALEDASGTVPVIESYRVSPDSKKGYPPPIFPQSRIPESFISKVISNKGKVKNLTGPAGTHFLFTPNIIHRGTEPSERGYPRRAIFFFLRPCLQKQSNYSTSAKPEAAKVNVKKYELD